MNQIVVDSWNFFKNNAKELCAFMLPVFALAVIAVVLGAINPKNPILGVLSIVQIMIGPLFTGGLLLLIANIAKGEHPPHKEMLSQAMPFWLTLFMVSILTGLIVGMGTIFLIIPGIWFLLRFFLAPLYVVFQKKSVTTAMRDSFADSKGHLLTFFQVLIPFLAVGVVMILFALSRGQTGPGLVSGIIFNVVTTFGFILASIVRFRLYTVYIDKQKNEERMEEGL